MDTDERLSTGKLAQAQASCLKLRQSGLAASAIGKRCARIALRSMRE
jgi:hypothetical protein